MELNKIYNEDCYTGIKRIPDKSVDLVYIDIPYLMDSGGCSGSSLGERLQRLNFEEIMDIRQGIDYSIFDELVRVMKHIFIFVWCSKNQIHDIMHIFIDKYKCSFNMLVWCKTNPTPACNGTWLPDLEYCLVFKDKDAPKYNDGYELKSRFHVSPINKQDKDLYDHPTIKPLELVKRHILHATQKGDVVLDCFIGSGTTAVACKETGRNFIGFEINPDYYNKAIDRLNGLTRAEKELIESGQQVLDLF